jgi:hypothetical protein
LLKFPHWIRGGRFKLTALAIATAQFLKGAGYSDFREAISIEKRYFTSDSHHPLVGFVDLLDRNDLHVGGDVVLAAEVEHLLRLGEPPMAEPDRLRRPKMRPKAATGSGFSGAPTRVMLPSRVSRLM